MKVGQQAHTETLSRRTPLAVRGEPALWLTGMALTLSLTAIAALLGTTLWQGAGSFWPRPVELVTLTTGERFLGAPVRTERYHPEPARREQLLRRMEAGELGPDVFTADGGVRRRLYRVGNKEFNSQPFRWVDLLDIQTIERPREALLLERTQWGVWLGLPKRLLLVEEKTLAPDAAVEEQGVVETAWGQRPVERTVLGRSDDGLRVRETTVLADGPEATLALLRELHPEAVKRRQRIESLKKRDIGWVNTRLERARLALRQAELAHAEGRLDDDGLAHARDRFARRKETLDEEYDAILQEIHRIEREDDRFRIEVVDPASGRFAPAAQTQPDEPLRLSQIVRAVQSNALDWRGRLGVYLDRWWEFLTADPREANTEGGVFPVIFGTVMLTLLLAVIVAPLGVVAALYLREYARQGLLISTVRIAINNLAGVPSIVYGVFGLGFFCYTVGGWIDAGPANPWPIGLWALGVGGLVATTVGAVLLGLTAKPRPGAEPTLRTRTLGLVAGALWLATAALVVALVAYMPFFHGFFRARLPSPTFGAKGLLWSSLTLALLTLPVVVVATEEAISSVPGSLREASYGCGASRWQTIRRVVLPMAMPGVMTGMILAIARGAGEVAPLMLVGAVKLAPELPFEPHFPFLHLERSFMHLGFHIYDVGFQSPDSEAARPIVWTTTLLLIAIVFTLNLAAILLRARLRTRLGARAV